MVAKIAIYSENGTHVDDVIYYRGEIEFDYALKWKWWCRYLAARVQVSNPRRKVELYVGRQDVLLGEEWKQYKTATLLRHRRARLVKLEREKVVSDLFGFNLEWRRKCIERCKQEIEQLENGEYPLPEFPDYINKIREWI